jgi:hypothetical protein
MLALPRLQAGDRLLGQPGQPQRLTALRVGRGRLRMAAARLAQAALGDDALFHELLVATQVLSGQLGLGRQLRQTPPHFRQLGAAQPRQHLASADAGIGRHGQRFDQPGQWSRHHELLARGHGDNGRQAGNLACVPRLERSALHTQCLRLLGGKPKRRVVRPGGGERLPAPRSPVARRFVHLLSLGSVAPATGSDRAPIRLARTMAAIPKGHLSRGPARPQPVLPRAAAGQSFRRPERPPTVRAHRPAGRGHTPRPSGRELNRKRFC